MCAVCTAALERERVRQRPGDRSVRTFRRPSLAPPFTETTERGENEWDENCQVADEAS